MRIAAAGARSAEVRAALDSMTEFIRYRSGLELNGEAKGRLAQMEERVLNGNGQRLQTDELGNLLTTILVERLHDCTDSEIEQAADAAINVQTMPLKYDRATKTITHIDPAKEAQAAAEHRGDDDGPRAPGRCKSSSELMLRFNGEGKMPRETFILQAKSLRSRFQSPLQQVALFGVARQMITKIVRSRVAMLSAALPDQWAEAQEKGLTPAQAFLVAYSTVSDDPLWHSRMELKNMGKSLARMWQEDTGEVISYEGRSAFGKGGYLFSSPLDLALNPETTARLLQLINERSAT
jgi:hypothetical protein